MTITAKGVLIVIALVLFFIAFIWDAFPAQNNRLSGLNLVAGGLFCWLLSTVIS